MSDSTATTCCYQDLPANEQLLQASQRVLEALQDLCSRHSCHPALISLISLETHTWPDTSLGIPVPGQIYAQIQTPGLVIRLQAADTLHTYHTSMQGPPRCLDAPPVPDTDADHPLIAGAMLDLAQYLGVGYAQIEFDRAESASPDLTTAQASPPSPAATWRVFLRHGRHTFRYQGPPEGPLVLIPDPTQFHGTK